MANLLVLLELHDGVVLPVSLEALGQARRVASRLGATLYALVPMPQAPAYGEGDMIELSARHGADKVVLLTDEALSSEREMRYGTHGPALRAACEQLPPALLLMGATPAASDIAPRLAAHLGATYLPRGFLDADDALRLNQGDGTPLRLGDDGHLERSVVLTVPPGRYQVASGDDDAEMIIIAASAEPEFVEVGREPAPPHRVVGTGPRAEALRQALPQALEAPLVVWQVEEAGPGDHQAAPAPAPCPRVPGALHVSLGGSGEGADYLLPDAEVDGLVGELTDATRTPQAAPPQAAPPQGEAP